MAYNIKEYRRILNDPYHTTSKDWGGWSKWYKDVYSKSQLASLGAAERKAKQQYATFTTQARNQLTQSVQQMKQTVETDALRRGMSRSSMPGSVIGSETERMGEQYQKQDKAARSGLEKTVASVRANRKNIADIVNRTGGISKLFKDYNAIDSETLAALTNEKVDFSVIGEMAKTGANSRDIIQKKKDLQAQQQNRDKIRTAYAAKDYTGYEVIKDKWFKDVYGLDKDDYDINSKADTLGNRLYFSRLDKFQSLVDIAKSNFDDKLNAYLETAKYAPDQALKHLYPETPETVFDLSKEFQKKGIVSSDGKINLNKTGSLYSEYKANNYSKLNYKYNETDPEDKRRKENGEMPLSLEKEYADTPEDRKRKKDGELPLSVENKINVENAYNTRLAELIRKKEAGTLSEQDIKDAANDKTIKAYDEWLAQDWDNRRALSQASSRSPEAHEYFKNLKTAPASYAADTFASMKAHGFTGIGTLFNEWWDGIKQAAITKNEEYFTKSLADFKAEYKDVVFKRDPETGKFIPVPIDTKNKAADQPYVIDYNNPVLASSVNADNQPAYFWQPAANNPLAQLFDLEDNLAKAVSQFKYFTEQAAQREKDKADYIEQSTKEEFHLKPTGNGGYVSSFVKPVTTDSQTGVYVIMPAQDGKGAYLTFANAAGEQAEVTEYFLSIDDAQTAAKSYAEQYKNGGVYAVNTINSELNKKYTDKLYQEGKPRAFISGIDDKDVRTWDLGAPSNNQLAKAFRMLLGVEMTEADKKKLEDAEKAETEDYLKKYGHLPPKSGASILTTNPYLNNPVSQFVSGGADSISMELPNLMARGVAAIQGENSPYAQMLKGKDRLKVQNSLAYGAGEFAGMFVPVVGLEKSLVTLGKSALGKSVPILSKVLSSKLATSTLALDIYGVVKDVGSGKSFEEGALNLLQNTVFGVLLGGAAEYFPKIVPGAGSLLGKEFAKRGAPIGASMESWQKSLVWELANELEIIAKDPEFMKAVKEASQPKGRMLKTGELPGGRPIDTASTSIIKNNVRKPFSLEIGNPVERISNLKAQTVANAIKDTGIIMKDGDLVVLTIRNGKLVRAIPYDSIQIKSILAVEDGSISRVFRYDGVAAGGINPFFIDVTKAMDTQAHMMVGDLERAAAQAGEKGVGGEYYKSIGHLNQNTPSIKFSKDKVEGYIKNIQHRGTLLFEGKQLSNMNGLDLDEFEIKTWNDLLHIGNDVDLVKRSNVIKQKSSDAFLNGVNTELKAMKGSNPNTTIGRIEDCFKKEVRLALIDVRNGSISAMQAEEIIISCFKMNKIPRGGVVIIWTNEGFVSAIVQ